MKALPITKVKVTDSKYARAHAASLVLERGCVWYVKRKWSQEVIDQCAEFPTGENDDLVDTVTMAALWMRRRWNAEYLDENDDEEVNLMRQAIGRRKSIYG